MKLIIERSVDIEQKTVFTFFFIKKILKLRTIKK